MSVSGMGRLTCLLHAGMHKTGTTSIQQALAASDLHVADGRCAYLRLAAPNFSGVFVTLYRTDATHHMSNWLHGRDEANVTARRRNLELRLKTELDTITADEATTAILISAEALSSPKDEGARQRFRDAMLPWCREIRVQAYVRPPVSFLESHFLQWLKASRKTDFDLHQLWPQYRARFEPLDQIFGAGSVALALYDPARFPGGDVVRDFVGRVGLVTTQAEAASVRLNRGLSLEAAALLFMLRRSGVLAPRTAEAVKGSIGLADAMAELGSNRLRFAPGLVAEVLDGAAADLGWMERRLGQSITDAGRADGIRGEADLREIAAASRGLLAMLEDVDLPTVGGLALTPTLLDRLLSEGLAA